MLIQIYKSSRNNFAQKTFNFPHNFWLPGLLFSSTDLSNFSKLSQRYERHGLTAAKISQNRCHIFVKLSEKNG